MSFFEECKFCAKDVYGSNGLFSSLGTLNGQDLWNFFPIQEKRYYVDSKSGFGGMVTYNQTDKILIVAFRGTVFTTLQDLINDIDLSDSYSPPQYEISRAFLQMVKEEIQKQGLPSDITILLTGHSLGGGLAQLIGAETGYQTLTFNAVGMQQLTNNLDVMGFVSYDPNGKYENIVNYAISSDIVANSFDTIGHQIFAVGTPRPSNPRHWGEYYLDAHMCILGQPYDESKFTSNEQTSEGKFFKKIRQKYPWLLKRLDTCTQLACRFSTNIEECFGDFPLAGLAGFLQHKNPIGLSIHAGDLRDSHGDKCIYHDPVAGLSVIQNA